MGRLLDTSSKRFCVTGVSKDGRMGAWNARCGLSIREAAATARQESARTGGFVCVQGAVLERSEWGGYALTPKEHHLGCFHAGRRSEVALFDKRMRQAIKGARADALARKIAHFSGEGV